MEDGAYRDNAELLAEVRRLRASNAELLKALKAARPIVVEQCQAYAGETARQNPFVARLEKVLRQMDAAIATGGQ